MMRHRFSPQMLFQSALMKKLLWTISLFLLSLFFFFSVTFKVYNSSSFFSCWCDGELLQLINKVIYTHHCPRLTQRQHVHFQQLSAPDRHVVGLNPRPSTGKHKHIAGSEERLVQYSQVK